MKGIQIFKILGILITLLVCMSGSYAASPTDLNTNDNLNQLADQTVDDFGNIVDDSAADDSGVDDSGVDDSGVDDSGVDDSGVDDSGVDDSGVDDYYTIDPGYMYSTDYLYNTRNIEFKEFDSTDESSESNILLAAGSDDFDIGDSGSDDGTGDGSTDDNGSDDNSGTDDGYVDDNGSDDNSETDDGSLDDNGSEIYYATGSDSASGTGNGYVEDPQEAQKNTQNDTNSIPMQHTGVPVLPAFLGVLSLMGGLVINKKRS